MHIHSFRQRFLNASLNSKLKYIYSGLLLFCLLCNIFILRTFFSNELKKAVSSLTAQTIETVSNNTNNSLDVISETSTYLLGTTAIQEYLENTHDSEYAVIARQLRNSLYLSLESMPMVSSIMIIRPSGVYEEAARRTHVSVPNKNLQDAAWYQTLCEKKGAPVFTANEDGFFEFKDGKNYITLMRLVNSTEDAHFLGYMAIHISVDSLFAFARDSHDGYSDFYVSSDSGTNAILPFLCEELNEWIAGTPAASIASGSIISPGSSRFLLLKFQEPDFGWDYIAAINYNNFTSQTRPFLTASIWILAVSFCFFMLIAFCTNHFLTSPLKRLMTAMGSMENGHFQQVKVTPYYDEIGRLQKVYNNMVDKIQELLAAKISEQKILRRTELNVLQEQIKPHFLYNSLGAISYLVTAEENDSAYDLLLALSDYYRESLSKGSEIIPLATEVNIVRNYLKLQKIRFPDAFEDDYHIQEPAMAYKVPRLILQPLAENALYHGLIPSGESGMISVDIQIDASFLTICVSDNGVGMTDEKLRALRQKNDRQSFGLRGTIERMQIYYDTPDICVIESTAGRGTSVSFHIPVSKLEEYHGDTKTESHDC